MKTILTLIILLSMAIGSAMVCPSAFALSFYPTDANNIVADGFVDTDEWTDADYESDGVGLEGAMYAMWRNGYNVGSGNYSGQFQFLLHNIEQLDDQDDADYNVFDVFANDNPVNPLLTIWVFNDVDKSSASDPDWLDPSGLESLLGFSELDDRGFLVYNYDLTTYRHYLPEDTNPGDGGYDWDYYWGVYAAGGFNNSAYDEGLALATDDDNELYEVIYRSDSDGVARRGIKDPDYDSPDDGASTPLIVYWDGEISTVPEPGTIAMLGLGALGVLGAIRYRRK